HGDRQAPGQHRAAGRPGLRVHRPALHGARHRRRHARVVAARSRDPALQHGHGLHPRVRARRLPGQRVRGVARLAARHRHAGGGRRLVGGRAARAAGGGDRAVRRRLRDQHDPRLDGGGHAAALHPHGGAQGDAVPPRDLPPRGAERDDQPDHGDPAADQLPGGRGGGGGDGVRLPRLRPHDAGGRALQGHRPGRGRRAGRRRPGRRHQHPRGRGLHGPRPAHPGVSTQVNVEALPVSPPAASRRRAPRWWRAVLAIRHSTTATVGVAIVLVWVVLAVLAPLLAPYAPNVTDLAALAHTTPSRAHWLGTDHLGRDIASRILWGARPVLEIAPLAVLGATALGSLLGLAAGYKRGWLDLAVTRACDIVLSFPVIILYMIILTHF